MPTDLARRTLDAAPDAIVVIDAQGVIRFANGQVAVLFGYSHEDIVGQLVERLMPERFRTLHVAHRDEFAKNVRTRSMGAGLDLFGQRQDGTEFPIEISLSPIVDADRTLVAAAIRDVSERRRAQAELIAAREAAHAARESADRANRGKSRFLATASHDLRQPLQTLALLNGTLRRIVTNAEAAGALAQQERAIGAMSRLLNSLLDVSKLESGAIRPEPADFSVAGVFEELREEFASVAAAKGLRLEIDCCGESVHSDPSLVGQILRNLLANAIKYTRAGMVQLRCLHEAALIRIEVVDTGIGIGADQLPHIWDDFYQVGVAANSSREGYGLGLGIVHRLVKLLALKIDVHSELGKGSAFSLSLPASHALAAAIESETTGSRALVPQIGRVQVLLVEDDEAVRAATKMLLKVEGFRVAAVATLADAMQHLSDGNVIDVLITDYHLSGVETGTQVIAAVRAARGATLRSVLITGDTSAAVKELPRDPQLRIASKPIDADELMTLLRALLAS